MPMTMPTTKAATLPSHVRTPFQYASALRTPVNSVLMATEDTKSSGILRGQRGDPLKPLSPESPLREPGVERPLFLLRPRAAEFLQGGVDPIAREVVLVAEHAPHPLGVRVTELDLDVLDDLRVKEDIADLLLRFDVHAEFRERGLECAVLLDERKCLLRTDAFHALVEVRTDQQPDVDELLPGDPEPHERGLEDDFLGLHVDVDVLARQFPAARDREVLHEP